MLTLLNRVSCSTSRRRRIPASISDLLENGETPWTSTPGNRWAGYWRISSRSISVDRNPISGTVIAGNLAHRRTDSGIWGSPEVTYTAQANNPTVAVPRSVPDANLAAARLVSKVTHPYNSTPRAISSVEDPMEKLCFVVFQVSPAYPRSAIAKSAARFPPRRNGKCFQGCRGFRIRRYSRGARIFLEQLIHSDAHREG